MSYRSFIAESLQAASEVANAQFGKVTGENKGSDNNQVLTATDLEIGQLLIARIQQAYPDHNIIDEEAGVIDKKSDLTWVVDPIDGTSNFANGVPLFGVMMGLLQGAVPIAGGIALPAFNQIFTSEKGQGTMLGDKRVKVTEATELLSTLVAYGIDGHQENPELTIKESQIVGKIVLNIRNLRSSNSAFDIGMLITGKYGAALNRSSKIWDNVAVQSLVEEAGGIYTDYFGQPIDYSQPLTKAELNFTSCAAAPALHEKIQAILAPFKKNYA